MFDYPSDEDLDAIREAEGWKKVLDLAIKAWDEDGVTFQLRPEEQALVDAQALRSEEKRKYVRFATGGWSGNEDIMQALCQNVWASMNWEFSASGGLHVYRYPLEEGED